MNTNSMMINNLSTTHTVRSVSVVKSWKTYRKKLLEGAHEMHNILRQVI